MLPTRMRSFMMPSMFSPSAMMRIEPTAEISVISASVRNGASTPASSAMPPW